MRFREIVQPLIEVTVPQDLLAPRYFHGTADYYDAQQVLHYGLLPPDFAAEGRTKNVALRPVEGRIYLTPNAKAARLYGRYLFVINRENLVGDLQPDEDEVGDVYHWISQEHFFDVERERKVHADSLDFLARMDVLRAPENNHGRLAFKAFMDRTLTPNTRRHVMNGDYIWWAKAGKTALKKMPPHLLRWLISVGVHLSHQGAIRPDEAWEVVEDGLLPDGSNLAEVAKPLARDPAVAPHDRTAPVFAYKVTFSFVYPAGSKPRQTQEEFRAISDADARRKATFFIQRRTTADAGYQIVSVERVGTEPVHVPAQTGRTPA